MRVAPGGWSSATPVAGQGPIPGTASSLPLPAATEMSSAAGAVPSGYPTAATTSPPQTIAATSASSASAARSTAASAAEASVSQDETALGDLRDAGQRALREVGAADVAHLLLAGLAAQPQGVGHREADERSRVRAFRPHRAGLPQVDVERRPVVERVNQVTLAARHQHRLANPLPAVPNADP